jgi:hypothetical protein
MMTKSKWRTYYVIPPVLYDRNHFENTNKTEFDIKKLFKRLKGSLHNFIGAPVDHSYVKDDNTCVLRYAYLLDEPFDPFNPDGLRLAEEITITIQIERTQGQHTLEDCPWKREFRKLKDD